MHAAQLLSDEELFALEDTVADYVELQSSMGVITLEAPSTCEFEDKSREYRAGARQAALFPSCLEERQSASTDGDAGDPQPGLVFLKVALGRCRPHTRSGRACPCAPSATWAPRGHGAIAVCPY